MEHNCKLCGTPIKLPGFCCWSCEKQWKDDYGREENEVVQECKETNQETKRDEREGDREAAD